MFYLLRCSWSAKNISTTCGKWLGRRRWKTKRWLCNSIARSSAMMSSTSLSYVSQANTYEKAHRQQKPLEKHRAPKQLHWKLLSNVFAGFSKRYGLKWARARRTGIGHGQSAILRVHKIPPTVFVYAAAQSLTSFSPYAHSSFIRWSVRDTPTLPSIDGDVCIRTICIVCALARTFCFHLHCSFFVVHVSLIGCTLILLFEFE